MEFWNQLRQQIKSIIYMNDEVDTLGAVEKIRSNIWFRGPNVWILAFSIVIASVGLIVQRHQYRGADICYLHSIAGVEHQLHGRDYRRDARVTVDGTDYRHRPGFGYQRHPIAQERPQEPSGDGPDQSRCLLPVLSGFTSRTCEPD